MTRFISMTTTMLFACCLPAFAETRTYDLSPFDEIIASDAIDVVYTQGPLQSVSVETDSGEFSMLLIDAENGRLRVGRTDVASATTVSVFDGLNSTVVRSDNEISIERGANTDIEISSGVNSEREVRINGELVSDLVKRRRSLPANITVRRGLFRRVIEINDRRRSKVTVRVTTPEISKITALAGASVEALNIDIPELELRSEAIGRITVTGACGSLEVTARDTARVDARNLECINVDARVGHSARITVNGSNEVVARAAHSGHVRIFGNPEIVDKSRSHRGRVTVSSH